MKLALIKCGEDDWYSIENMENGDYDAMLQLSPNCHSLIRARRICDACVEGSSFEMKALAQAIKDGRKIEFKRCAVEVRKRLQEVNFWSPRNSRTKATIYLPDALEFAEQILKELK